MGFYVTLFYLAFMISSPSELVPELAPYRLQWIVGGLAVLSTAVLITSTGYPVRNRQTLLMAGFFFMIPFSRFMRGWMGGAVYSISEFGATAVVFFLLIAAPPSLSRIRHIAVALCLPAFYACLRGILATYAGWNRETYILAQNVFDSKSLQHTITDRIRFVGSFSDPNDLAQYFLVVIPFVGLLWRRGAVVRNFAVVIPLLFVLLFSIFLTHSRGGLLGLVVLIAVLMREYFNKVVMTIGSAALTVALLAANFAGGRSIDFNSGSDRIEAWGAGLSMLRSSPLWGIGYNLFTEHNDITAHNSFVLCFAELGLLGFFFWLGLVVSTVLGLTQFLRRFRGLPGAEDLVRWGTAVRLALIGFLVTSWFLSRTYSVLLFVLVAMFVLLEKSGNRLLASSPAVASWVQQREQQSTRVRSQRGWHWLPTTATVQVTCLLTVWVLVRARWSN